MKKIEGERFEDEKYVEDLLGETNEEIKHIISLDSPEQNLAVQMHQMSINEEDLLTKEEKEIVLKLKNRQMMMPDDMSGLLNQMLEIVYGYLFDRRITYFEHNCESSWTISRLSSALSCFCGLRDQSMSQVLISSFRKSLIYPLYRNFELSLRVLEELKLVLGKGRILILKCFIQIKQINEKREGAYLLNDFFIDDFIIWIQQIPEETITQFAQTLNSCPTPTKPDMDLCLTEIEKFAADCYK